MLWYITTNANTSTLWNLDVSLPVFFCLIFTNCTMITTTPQVSYDDFVAAGSLGVAREKGLVKIFALLNLTFSDLKHVVKNMLSLLVYLICYFDCSWGWKERIMLCRKEMSCFSDSTCDNNSSKKLQDTGICTRQNIVCPDWHFFGLLTTDYRSTSIVSFLMRKNTMVHSVWVSYVKERHPAIVIQCRFPSNTSGGLMGNSRYVAKSAWSFAMTL